MQKEKLYQKNVIESEVELLKKCFPQYFDKNGNFLIEKFKKAIEAKGADISKESYSLEWLGKSYARVLANDPVRTYVKEERVWNAKPQNRDSQNILIKGDNLEVLKHLVNAYESEIKMIYIDPPYNTGNDGFVYQDNRKFTPEELAKLAGIDIQKAKRILDFLNSKSNSHSAWLTFMYPRLYIARRLLKEDGVIFVSIDDNEVAQLRLLMDEIFGEENFLGQLVVKSNPGGRDYGGIAQTHEYIIVYAKSDNSELFLIDDEREFPFHDNISGFEIRELRNRNIKFNINNRPNLYYPFYVNPNKIDSNGLYEVSLEYREGFIEVYPKESQGIKTVWRWGKEKALERLNVDIKAKKKQDGNFMIIEKYRNNARRIRSILDEKNVRNEKGSLDIKELFGNKPFDYPKSVHLIKILLKIGIKEEEFVLDFFAGSGTTGDAVMQLNAEDGGNRKFILIQLPEPIDPKKNKTAYDFVKNELGVENPTIFEITKERLIRAAQKIRDEKEPERVESIDLGFKIFETVDMPEEIFEEYEEVPQNLPLMHDMDTNTLLTTWKLYDGVKLTEEAKEIDLNGYRAYLAGNRLYLLEGGFTTENLAAMLRKIDEEANFAPSKIVANGYALSSKAQREIYEGVLNFANKKHIELEFIVRY